jgi:hypothetical protein
MEAAGIISSPPLGRKGDALNRDLVTETFVFFSVENIFQVLGYLVTKK